MKPNALNKISAEPDICASGNTKTRTAGSKKEYYAPITDISLENVKAAFGIALHMHQPTIPAETDDIRSSALISNLQYMMEHQHIGDNHNAPVFMNCYSRISDFIRELVSQGKSPRVMLDYSGNLLWGLSQMGEGSVLENLKLVTCDKKYHRNVEWLGTMWSHAVVPSTPVPDIKLHITAWQSQFASIFGKSALDRVKGFSAPEMHLPIHPDLCFVYIKALKECGYRWLMAQEHTVENLDGSPIRRPHIPHRLVARNSAGHAESIAVLIKTQGSDTKLVAQMQPYYEAVSRGTEELGGKRIPPYVLQIADGENGGVMMNEFPPMYLKVSNELGTTGVVALNGTEYLELVQRTGVQEEDFLPIQPISQHRIWDHVNEFKPGSCDRAVEKIREKDQGFNLDRGSWTNDKNWVKGYAGVLDPMNRLSAEFHRKFDAVKNPEKENGYKEALLYLLLSQTSCFRYWGEGLWTEYAKEICRRGEESLKKDVLSKR
ncbi:MAG: glycosyl hydrolase family 57 [Candidatus Omnitrophota bacterium]